MVFKVTDEKSRQAALSYIEKLPEWKRYNVTVVLHKKKRSLPQNRLYHLWLNCISSETGNDVETLHDYFKGRFLSRKFEVFGEEYIARVSTTKLNTAEFTAYLDRIQQFASEEGIVLPDPNDLYFEQFYERYKDYI